MVFVRNTEFNCLDKVTITKYFVKRFRLLKEFAFVLQECTAFETIEMTDLQLSPLGHKRELSL